MDDFLGTSIQYSEQQILLLEKQHAADLQKTVEDLIASGFLDSDYESEYTDTESELNNDVKFDSDSESEIIDDEKMNISPRTTHSNHSSSNLNISSDDEGHDTFHYDDLAVVLYSNDCDIYGSKNTDCPFISTFGHLMDIIITDIKSLMILFLLMLALPNIMDHDQESSVYRHHQSSVYKHQDIPILRQTSVYCFYQTKTNHINDDERDEYDINKVHIDVMTTTINPSTNRICSSKVSHHEFNVNIKGYISKGIPRLFLHFGAGINGPKSPQIARIFRDTVSHSVGRHFVPQHLTALVMSFVGFAAITAASNSNIDEYLALSSQ